MYVDRPKQVTIISIAVIVKSIAGLLLAMTVFVYLTSPDFNEPEGPQLFFYGSLLEVIMYIVSLVGIYGLWNGQRWGYRITVIMLIINIMLLSFSFNTLRDIIYAIQLAINLALLIFMTTSKPIKKFIEMDIHDRY